MKEMLTLVQHAFLQNTSANMLMVELGAHFHTKKVTCLQSCSGKCNGALLTYKED